MSLVDHLEVRIDPDEVLNAFLRQCRITTQGLRYAHAAIRVNTLEALPMLEVDGLAYTINDQSEPDSAKQTSETDAWLLRSAFVDLQSGLNEGLMAGCRALWLHALARGTVHQPFRSQEEAAAKIDRLEDELMRMHVPELMNELQDRLVDPLALAAEVLSINKVRNCLIHRNGIVSSRDVNMAESQVLRLQYLQQQFYILVNGVPQRLNREVKAKSVMVSGVNVDYPQALMDFPVGAPIILSTDLFNDCFYTCHRFLVQLRRRVFVVLGLDPPEVDEQIILVRADDRRENG